MRTIASAIKDNIIEVENPRLFAYAAYYNSSSVYDEFQDYAYTGNASSTFQTVVDITGSPGLFQAVIAGAINNRVKITMDGTIYDLTAGSGSSGRTAVVLPKLFPQGQSALPLQESQVKQMAILSPAIIFRDSLKVEVLGGNNTTAALGARVCAKVGKEWIA
jgi:hypothetical protein